MSVLALDDDAFLAAFQQRFGYRLGRFLRVGRRAAYPLSLLRARESVRGRVAVIGNAAHTLHPIAGQGFNLGIRDVAALAEVVDDAFAAGADIGSADRLCDAYERWRTAGTAQRRPGDRRSGASVQQSAAAWCALAATSACWRWNLVPGAKHPLARAAMGLLGRQPRLARGVPLG